MNQLLDTSWIVPYLKLDTFLDAGFRWKRSRHDKQKYHFIHPFHGTMLTIWKSCNEWGALSGCGYRTLAEAKEGELHLLCKQLHAALNHIVVAMDSCAPENYYAVTSRIHALLQICLTRWLRDKAANVIAPSSARIRGKQERFGNAAYAADHDGRLISLLDPSIHFRTNDGFVELNLANVSVGLTADVFSDGCWRTDNGFGVNGKKVYPISVFDTHRMNALVRGIAEQVESYLCQKIIA